MTRLAATFLVPKVATRCMVRIRLLLPRDRNLDGDRLYGLPVHA